MSAKNLHRAIDALQKCKQAKAHPKLIQRCEQLVIEAARVSAAEFHIYKHFMNIFDDKQMLKLLAALERD